MTKSKDYSKISSYFMENWYIVLPMSVTALFFDGLMCFLPIIEGRTIDSLKTGDANVVARYCAVFIALVLFVQINRFFKRYLVRVFGNKISLKMRQASLDNLLSRDMTYFESCSSGDVLNRNLSDIYDTAEGIRKMTTEVFDTFVLLFGYVAMMFTIDWKLTAISLPFFALSIFTAQLMKKLVYKNNKAYKEYLSKNKSVTLTMLGNELYYRGFGSSLDYYNAYDESLEELRKKATKALLFQSSLEPLYICIAMCGLGLVTYIGGGYIIRGENAQFTIGVLTSFITTYMLVGKKAGKVGKLFNAYQAFKVSWQRCKEYLTPTKNEAQVLRLTSDELVLKDFSYQYDGHFKLPKVNLTAKEGDVIGVCGKVHCGKTTLLKGLSGLYSYEGNGTIGGIEISSLKNAEKQLVSYCSTNVELFSATVKENIELGRAGDLKNALSVSALDRDLDKLGGLDKVMSRTTSNLSGGQQKRLQMCRALYSDAFLILLDDPFQSVDAPLAKQMITALQSYKNSIVVLVSNNAEILKKTTKIVFFDVDKSGVGSFSELLLDKAFARLIGGEI